MKGLKILAIIVTCSIFVFPKMAEAGVLPIEIEFKVGEVLRVLGDWVTEFIERKNESQEKEIKNSVPNLIIKFNELAAEKGALARDLEDYADILSRAADPTVDIRREERVQARINTDVSSVSRILSDIDGILKKLDPEWAKDHSVETGQVFEVVKSRKRLVLNLLADTPTNKMTSKQARDIAQKFIKEKMGLKKLAKTLGDTFQQTAN